MANGGKESQTHSERVLELVRKAGVVRPRDLDALEIPREYLRRLHAAGVLQRPGRGIYVASDARPTEGQSLAELLVSLLREFLLPPSEAIVRGEEFSANWAPGGPWGKRGG